MLIMFRSCRTFCRCVRRVVHLLVTYTSASAVLCAMIDCHSEI